MDLLTNTGLITVNEVQYRCPVCKLVTLHNVNRAEPVSAASEDADIDQAIWTMRFRSFSEDPSLHDKLRDVL